MLQYFKEDQNMHENSHNPIDQAKALYESVMIAESYNNYYIEASDIQGCAVLNDEDVIDTLNNIIRANEANITADNLVVVIDEYTSEDTIMALSNAGVLLEVSFKFLPRLSRTPGMRDLTNTMRDAQDICNSRGIETKAGALKACRIILRILGLIYNIHDTIKLPLIIFLPIVGVVWYLIDRTWEWLIANGEVSVAKSQGAKILAALKRNIDATTDKKEKEKLQETYDKLVSAMEHVEESIF